MLCAYSHADYCEPLPLSNGDVTYSTTANSEGNLVSGTTATHECSEGFSLVGGENRTCIGSSDGSERGTWSGMASICERENK